MPGVAGIEPSGGEGPKPIYHSEIRKGTGGRLRPLGEHLTAR
jgi:hypothetical protein